MAMFQGSHSKNRYRNYEIGIKIFKSLLISRPTPQLFHCQSDPPPPPLTKTSKIVGTLKAGLWLTSIFLGEGIV